MKTEAELITKYKIADLCASIKKTFLKISSGFKDIFVSSGDYAYKIQFLAKYLPGLYERHTADQKANCVFCANLVRTSCHLHCLKCRVGTYVHCSPLLPGVLQYGDRHATAQDSSALPWFFKNPCSNFKRLARSRYARNLKVPFSWLTIYNYEVLEGLAEGCLAGRKPCSVCASVDYEIYKRCSSRKGFDEATPCPQAVREIVAVYNL